MRSCALVALLALIACDKGGATGHPPQSDLAAPQRHLPGVSAHASATAQGGGATAVKESTETYEFDYSYPAAAGRIPALRAWLEGERRRHRSELIAEARAGRREARQGGYDFHPYGLGYEWKVVTDLPDWLSLSTLIYSQTGGAHPNYAYQALLWDKRANRQREATSLFTSRQAFSSAVEQAFCAQIDRQREAKRGEPVKRGEGMFSDCLDPAAQTVILGSSNRRTFDRIGFLVGPYEAGPYVEGEYEVTLPVTPAVLAAVKPEYRAAFSVKR